MPTIYYVYQYLRSDGTPYYIGKGYGNRAYSKYHNVHLPEDQKNIIILKENMLETDAFSLEIELIAKYGRKDIGTGILRNLTNGGEGVSGYTHKKKLDINNLFLRKIVAKLHKKLEIKCLPLRKRDLIIQKNELKQLPLRNSYGQIQNTTISNHPL